MKFERKVSSALASAALTVALTCVAFAQGSSPNPRIALVIGEAAYPDHPLATTANDAGLIAQTLQAAGFDVVGARDLDEKSLRQALRDFLDKSNAAGPDGVDFVYLSGRALQYAGDNYFVPVDAQIARDVDVPIETVKITDFTHALAAVTGRSHIIVIDGARANNYALQTPLAPGLALIDPEKGELLAFNAAPGTVAPEETGSFGVFGKDLAGALRQGGVPLEDIFAQTRVQVSQDTQGAVVPWSASALAAPVFIFDRAADSPPPAAVAASEALSHAPLRTLGPERAYTAAIARDTFAGYQEYVAAYPNSPEARRVRAMLAARREAAFWRHSVGENSPRAYWTYVKRYPNGPHVADASRRLTLLSQPEAPPPDFEPVDFADLPPPPPDEGFYEERPVAYFGGDDYGPPPPPPPPDFAPNYGDDWRDLPPPPPPQPNAYGYLPVLPIAVPLIAGAIAIDYRLHHKRGEAAPPNNGVAPAPPPGAPAAAPGRAPRSEQTAAPSPAAPPPLPKGVKPKPPPPPQAAPAPLLIPGTQGARPVSTAPAANLPRPAPGQPAPPQPAGQGTPAAAPAAPNAAPITAPPAAHVVPPATNAAPQPPGVRQLPTPAQTPAPTAPPSDGRTPAPSPSPAKPVAPTSQPGVITPPGGAVAPNHALPTPAAPQLKPAAPAGAPQTPAAPPRTEGKPVTPIAPPPPNTAPTGGAPSQSPNHTLPTPAAQQPKPEASPSTPAPAAPVHAPEMRHDGPKSETPILQPAAPKAPTGTPPAIKQTPLETKPVQPAPPAPTPRTAPPAATVAPQAKPVAPAAPAHAPPPPTLAPIAPQPKAVAPAPAAPPAHAAPPPTPAPAAPQPKPVAPAPAAPQAPSPHAPAPSPTACNKPPCPK